MTAKRLPRTNERALLELRARMALSTVGNRLFDATLFAVGGSLQVCRATADLVAALRPSRGTRSARRSSRAPEDRSLHRLGDREL